ncbi:MAG: TIGR02452 family protein, partial [Clostridia bacterium]|nr:TIGR02452 family protein [Clostridia bacterium]
MDSRQLRIEIFEGTRSLYQNSETLKSSVEKSRSEQTIYWEGEKIFFGKPRFSSPLKLVISKEKTVEAARKYAKAGKKGCILNFASSVAPGGGVVNGSQAQEESICRVSTLYFALSDKNTAGKFYDRHWELIHQGQFNRRNTDDIIYTPGVTVVRDDSNNEVELPENEWYQIDVITCAAPDIRNIVDETEYNPVENELYREFVKRWKCILSAGAKHKADVLILGAFGCGVFANPPKLVAEAFCEAVKGYEKYFEIIELAIYSPRENNANYNAFMNVLYGDSPIYPHYLQ